MSYSHLEKMILSGLKQRKKDIVARTPSGEGPAAGSAEELWDVIDGAYGNWRVVIPVQGNEIIKERLLDVVGCSETDLRVALKVLMDEELIEYHSYRAYKITALGLRACREFEGEV